MHYMCIENKPPANGYHRFGQCTQWYPWWDNWVMTHECDKLIGPFVRFPCGHSVCESCAENAGECSFCISSPAPYLVDKPQSTRVNNTTNLLNTFEDTFKIDVIKRKRISDHLKAEKLMFPECIQAPYTYCNKRKSLNVSLKNKKNIFPTIFPGEKVKESDKVTMKKSFEYVQNWLNENEGISKTVPRKPFGSINVNTQTLPNNNKKQGKQSTYRKKTQLKSIHKTSSLLYNMINHPSDNIQLKLKKEVDKRDNNQIYHELDKNESGIVIDDEAIVIEDTNEVDKDKLAWLAVLEQADKEEKKLNEILNVNNVETRVANIYYEADPVLSNNESKSQTIKTKNVLFFKRSTLSETCKQCNNYFKNQINHSSKEASKNDVSIVINNSAFITTIKFTNCEENQNQNFSKSSIAIQTDELTSIHKQEIITADRNITVEKRKQLLNEGGGQAKQMKTSITSESFDIFATNTQKELEKESICQRSSKQNICDNYTKPQKCLIIEDSDTDSSVSCNNTHEVEVEVHSVQCEVLKALSETEYQQRPKRQARGKTPNSSNSSDKENLDPNRNKKMKLKNKHKTKKQTLY